MRIGFYFYFLFLFNLCTLPVIFHASRKCSPWRKLYFTVDVYGYKTIESTGKNFVTFLHKFFHIDSIGITYQCTRKKLVYKSYKVFSYRLYRYPTTVCHLTSLLNKLTQSCWCIQKGLTSLFQMFYPRMNFNYWNIRSMDS